MTRAMISIRIDRVLVDEAAKFLNAKSRREAVQIALREIIALKRFKTLMAQYRGKLEFVQLGD